MEGHGLALTINPSLTPSLFHCRTRTTRTISFPPRKPKFVVMASKDEPPNNNIDQYDQMELKFGRMLGEDPNLTIAKIMGRKLNPEMSYLEIEKEFYRKQGKSLNTEVEEVPFDASRDGKSSNLPSGLNLIRPVPKKGVKFESSNKPVISEIKKPSQPLRAAIISTTKSSIPNVILRKPTTFKEDDIDNEKSSKLRIRPNLLLKMGKGQTKEKFSDITLLKKPEPVSLRLSPDKEQDPSESAKVSVRDGVEGNGLKTAATDDMGLLNKPERMDLSSNNGQEQKFSGDDIGMNSGDDLKEKSLEGENFSIETDTINGNFDDFLNTRDASLSKDPMLEDDSATGLQSLGNTDTRSEAKLEDSSINFSIEAALRGKPKRLDEYVKGTSKVSRQEAVLVNSESNGNAIELENFLAVSAIKDHEDMDWTKVDDLVKTGGRAEVELISCSTRGFVVSFGSLVGFLPYRNLAARWKFLAFESWLRRKGLDPSLYKQNLGIIGSFDATNMTTSRDSNPLQEIDQKVEREISPGMQLEDILRIYDQEKLKFLSSFVGQKIKVNVILADRRSRRLIFSVKPKEKEELVEKKRGLMARLSIGDVVKCCIKKITYFGIFVEVEGVPALIHQSEVTWDATLDPAPYFKVGQLLAVGVVGFGVWMSTHHDGCRKSLTLPVIGLGGFIFLISIIGFLGAMKNNSILLWIYLTMLCFVLVAILVFTVLAFIITNNGTGHNVAGLRYKEYQLRDYSSWFLRELNNTHNWKHLRSCLVKSYDCNDLSKRYKTLKQYKLAKLTPIEAGCCRPPSECGYPAVNASYYDLSFHPISSNKDCKLYKNSKATKCYDCDSCKAGVAQYMKTEWRVVAIFNVVLFVVLSMIYFVGCCARRNAARSQPKV